MIRVDGLTKIYKSKFKDSCIALDNVSFTLPNKGFVFIVGKSGSGKTTLLSLLGGLDEISKGDIVMMGQSVKDFSHKDFVDYRNSTIGFIFQDFHLLDELTIEENIRLSLSLQNIENDNPVQQALCDVGLQDYAKRYPKELSGGEKQRVAIARALVKNPHILLADEPTGNLDSKTTIQILTLLKKLSENRLVVIVSHNLADAREYADRIIELSYGKIINDLKRNPLYDSNVKIKQNHLFLPINKKLNDDEITIINDALKNGKINTLVQVDEVFVENNDSSIAQSVTYEKSKTTHISLKNTLKLGIKFLKKDALKVCVYSLIVACLIAILGLSELIATFKPSTIIQKELTSSNQHNIAIAKNDLVEQNISTNSSCIFDISDEEIQKYYDNGYEGNAYKLVNVTLQYGTHSTLCHSHLITTYSPTDTFYNGLRGTLVTTEEYIKNLFGSIEYVALADKIEDGGIYVTDYSADAMIFYAPGIFPDYKSVLGHNKSSNNNTFAYVNGIIKTGYKEKYDYYLNIFKDINLTSEQIQDIVSTREYQQYYDDVLMNLSIGYTTNPNFVDDFIELNAKTWCPTGNSSFEYNGESYTLPSTFFENSYTRTDKNLADNELTMNYSTYNQIFRTNYTEGTYKDFTPHEVTFRYSYYYDLNSVNTVYTFTAKIVELNNGYRISLSDNLFKQALRYNTFTSGVYFDDISDVETILNTADESGMYATSVIALSLSSVTKAVSVFSDFFYIIFFALCASGILIISSYGIKLIKERTYEIGILKSLGIRNKDLSLILGLQIVVLLVLTISFYIIGSYSFINLANDLLLTSIQEIAKDTFIIDVKILQMRGIHVLLNSSIVAGITLISFAFPLVKLYRLKPTNIMKSGD